MSVFLQRIAHLYTIKISTLFLRTHYYNYNFFKKWTIMIQIQTFEI